METQLTLNDFDCIVFDMDGTLAQSKGPISEKMATLLTTLLTKKKVAVISGGRWEQFQKQLIQHLDGAPLENLIILPTTGATMYRFDHGVWRVVYEEGIPLVERQRICSELQKALKQSGYHEEETFGDIIEDRKTQITFSGLGAQAPLEKKLLWDPLQQKRIVIKTLLDHPLHDYTITFGGTTSIDITPKGVDKAYGIEKIIQHTSIPVQKILFVGDKLMPGGNDYPATRTGVRVVPVVDEKDTEVFLEELLHNKTTV